MCPSGVEQYFATQYQAFFVNRYLWVFYCAKLGARVIRPLLPFFEELQFLEVASFHWYRTFG